jgi:hypothetical protein
VLGLAIVLVIFALEWAGSTPSFRRQITISAGFYDLATAGVALLLLSGEAVALGDQALGGWLSLFVWTGALVWAMVVLRAVGEAVRITDPVYRVELHKRLVLAAVDQALRRELIRNVATSLLSQALSSAGGQALPWTMPRSDQPESSRVRFAREGWVTDINVPALERAARGEARDGHALEVGIRLWDRVGAGALLAQGTRALPAGTVRLVRNAVRVRPVRAAPDIRGRIEALRREAQSSLGPDTTVLDAVLATWEERPGAVCDGLAALRTGIGVAIRDRTARRVGSAPRCHSRVPTRTHPCICPGPRAGGAVQPCVLPHSDPASSNRMAGAGILQSPWPLPRFLPGAGSC